MFYVCGASNHNTHVQQPSLSEEYKLQNGFSVTSHVCSVGPRSMFELPDLSDVEEHVEGNIGKAWHDGDLGC